MHKKSLTAAIVITLFQHGKEPNYILNLVVDEVLSGTVEGFDTRD